MTSLTDPEILHYLHQGYHLEAQELKRADQIVHSITQELKSRIRKWNGKYKYEVRWWTSRKKFKEWGFDESYRFKRKKEAEEFCLQLRKHECGEGGAYAYEVGYIFDSKGEGYDPFIFWNEEDGLTK